MDHDTELKQSKEKLNFGANYSLYIFISKYQPEKCKELIDERQDKLI